MKYFNVLYNKFLEKTYKSEFEEMHYLKNRIEYLKNCIYIDYVNFNGVDGDSMQSELKLKEKQLDKLIKKLENKGYKFYD